jgi:Right handed beta helix region/Periplasmic copper-binding protein (NosD)/Bacterial TSP3 repeat
MKRLLSSLLVVCLGCGFLLFMSDASAATVVGGNITTATTWTLAASPYEVTETVFVSRSARLTIEAGVRVQFNPGTALWIGHPSSDGSSDYRGSLTAEGTSEAKIIFTSANGFSDGWQGIIFGPRSDDYSSSSLLHCVIEKAGETNYLGWQANVTLNYTGSADAISMDHVEMGDSSSMGLYASYSQVSLSSGTLSGNGSHGLYAESSNLNISDTAANDNNGNGYDISGCGGILDGGQSSGNAGHGIAVGNNTSTAIENMSLTGNTGYGIFSEDFGSYFTATQNQFDGNVEYPARISSQCGFYDNSFSNSNQTGIELIGGSITARDVRWYVPGTGDDQHYIHTDITRVTFSRVLTIDPGVRVKFKTGSGLEIAHPTSDASSQYRGGLVVNGTATDPVLFTSESDLAGDWRGVVLGPRSDDNMTSTLSHLTIEKAGEVNTIGNSAGLTLYYAGSNTTFTECHFNASSNHGVFVSYSQLTQSGGGMSNNMGSGLAVSNGILRVDGLTISGNQADGLYCDESSGTFTDNQVMDNGGYGAYLNASSLTLADNTIARSGAYAVYYDLGNSNPVIESNLLADNTSPGIHVRGGALMGSHMMDNQTGEPVYTIFEAPISIQYSRQLTIAPGVTLKFSAGTGIWVGHPSSDGSSDYRGGLTAMGLSDAKILFTSADGSSNGWQGIVFGPRSDDYSNASLQYCIIENGGETNYLGEKANLHWYYTGNGFSFDHVTIRNSSACGLFTQYSALNSSNLSVYNNGSDGLDLNFSSGSIIDSIIVNNTATGIQINESVFTINNSYIAKNDNGIYCQGTLATNIHSNVITDQTGYGVVAASGIVVDAQNNYWGSDSGPFDPVDDTATGGLYNPEGTGASVSDDVDYDPWTGVVADRDGDGLPDFVETLAGTDLDEPDTDGDGVSDMQEVQEGLDPLITDGSGVPDDEPPVDTSDEDDDGGSGSSGCFMGTLNPS